MEKPEICASCRETYPHGQLIEFEGELYCSSCLGIETVVCAHCGRRMRNGDNVGDGELPLCRICYDSHYATCTRCGCIIHADNACFDDDDDPYCFECSTRHANQRAIRDYYYKPKPIFLGKGERFFGVELEVDTAGECNENAERVINIANGEGANRIYCKHDGSLDDGFEIVTHPMTLDYHMKTMPWKKVLEKLKSMDYLSHQAYTCGLHVHVNRSSLGVTEQDRDACIARILYFFEKHWDELLKFSRRTNSQLDRWAARYGYKEHPMEILDRAKKGTGGGRYSCINLQNQSTIEFRMFRGTLKYNTLIATLQLVDRVCDVAFSLSDAEMKALSWTSFVEECTQPELIQYLNIHKRANCL